MKKALLLLVLLLVLGGGAVAVVAATRPAPSEAAPGTTVGGVAVGGLDRQAMSDLLARTVDGGPAQVKALTGDRTTTLMRAELGLQVDVPATVDRVLADSGAGKTWGLFGERKGTAVVPVVVKDDDRLGPTSERIVKAAARPESHGDVTYRDGSVQVTPPRDGQQTDEEAVVSALADAMEKLPLPAEIEVPVEVLPMHVSAADLEPLADTARALVAGPLNLQAGALRTSVSGAALGGQLTVMPMGDEPGHPVALVLRPSASLALAEPVVKALSSTAAEPKVAAPAPQNLLSSKGDASWRPVKVATRLVAPGRAGQVVTTAKVLEVLKAHVAQGTRATAPIVLPVAPNPPATTDAQARAINSVLGTFTTSFSCCQPRVTNIALIARTIDGTVIGPGKTFSLNGIVGRRTRAKGYVEAPFILDGELSKDIGGGVSQFATTTLNAAFFAGLKLDRFQPHSFYISRYPAGREATVNFPGIDLKWTNDTGGAVLVRTATTSTSVTVTLYGRDDGRTVRSIAGPRTPVSGRDFRIRITREIAVPGQPVRQDSFRTTYNKPPPPE